MMPSRTKADPEPPDFTSENSTREIKLLSTDPELRLELAGRYTLSWLAYVRTSQVPLHQIVASAWDCVTDHGATQDWLEDVFLEHGDDDDEEEQPWWASNAAQSNVGVVFRMNDAVAAWTDGPPITEVLVYAARVSAAANANTLSTTQSESPGEIEESDTIVRIHALPLSSSLEPHADASSIFLPPALPDDDFIRGFVLADQQVSESEIDLKANNPGHQQGFKGAHAERSTIVNSQTAISPEGLGNDETSSISSRSQALDIVTDSKHSRSTTRSSLLKQATHPSESTSSYQEGSQSKTQDSQTDFSARNRAALQRVVLSGMRLYGLQQKKRSDSRKAKSHGNASLLSNPVPDAEDEEFKSIYHQTYKAAAFAMRRRFADQVLDPGTLRDVVDQVLALFCTQVP